MCELRFALSRKPSCRPTPRFREQRIAQSNQGHLALRAQLFIEPHDGQVISPVSVLMVNTPPTPSEIDEDGF
jgi:hypothetical protein